MNKEGLDDKLVSHKSETVGVALGEMMSAEGLEALSTVSVSEAASSAAAISERLEMVINARDDTNAEDDDDEEFEIPHLFTKSGRKRAVSFPLKVRSLCCNSNFHP
jgi:hypothetical protein